MVRLRILYLSFFIFISSICSFSALLAATAVRGQIVDLNTGEPMPFVQVLFVGTTIGTTSDIDGNFYLENTRGLTKVECRMVGYKTKTLTIKLNKTTDTFIALEPDVYALGDIVIKPDKKERYKRKGNPAVDLIKNVIANKDKNRLDWKEDYQMRSYEKMVMSLDPFDYNLDKNKLLRQFKFLEQYIDTVIIEKGVQTDSSVVATDTTNILNISLRETMADEYVVGGGNARKARKIITAKRWEGIDKIFETNNVSENLQAMFQPINIFANDINLLLNRFVSPLSSSLAVSFYQYYIMDTVMVDSVRCIDLAFVPVNSESFGFTGHLYIVADSTYALKRYQLNVPQHINLNWVSHLAIDETFQQIDNGLWAQKEVNTHVRFATKKRAKHNIYACQTRYFDRFQLQAQLPDSLFYMAGNTITRPDAEHIPTAVWDTMRPFALKDKELLVDSLERELMKVPVFRGIVNTLDDLIQEFIPTSRERKQSKWDFGPIFNTISYNEQEGGRLRIGGMTTANQNPHWFTSMYAAYGFNDQRFKGGITALYSFNKKKYHPYESLRHYISLTASYDLEEMGQTYKVLDRDHIFMSIKFNYEAKPMMYVARLRLKYEKEWANQLSLITWLEATNNQPNGSIGWGDEGRWAAPRINIDKRKPLLMTFNKRLADGTTITRPWYHETQWTLQLRYSPGGYIYNDRQGIESPYNLWKDAPVFRFTNEMGYIHEDHYFYNRIQLSAEYRFWLSAFGHLDATVDVGYVATNKAPYTKLFIPVSNQSILLDPKAFNLMQPMEFVMDRYASLHLTYYMKGWLFNRIPGIKLLKLREVISFHMLAGYLGDRNNPYITDGIYDLPCSYSLDGEFIRAKTSFADYNAQGDIRYNYMPYMEITAGIENIFKLIRIDYVRRLTHLNAPNTGQRLGPWKRNGIRITLRVAL